MASPQTENGHLDLANELVDKLAQTQLSGNEMRIIWAIWRKTYCWHKKEDWISYSQFQEVTKIGNWSHISRAIKKLLDKNMITKNGNKYGFQKDYHKWRLPKMVTEVTKIGKKRLPKLADTKETITKETYTKEIKATQVVATTNDLINLFKPINPSYERLFANKTQRAALERLVSKFGQEKVQSMITALPEILSRKYAPRITTPIQLETKLGELLQFIKQENSQKGKVGMV